MLTMTAARDSRGRTAVTGRRRPGPRARAVVALWLLAANAATAAPPSAGADLTVEKGVWTTRIENRQHGPEVPANATARPLYFWTRLKGGKAALETLQREGKLPIRHQWRHSNVFRSGVEEYEPVQESRELPAGAIQSQAGMRALVDSGATFTWRTWTHKQSVRGGRWTVTVLYATGEPVLCDGSPCSWTLQLRE